MGHGNNGVDMSLKLSWLQSHVDLKRHFVLHKVSATGEMGPVNGQAPLLSPSNMRPPSQWPACTTPDDRVSL